jgi:cysteine desulfurase/selenocysteine lyase
MDQTNSSWRSLFPALQFPALKTDLQPNTPSPVTYLDSASTCQVPAIVIDAISHYLTTGHGNAHRGMYQLSENANTLYQQCRDKVARFIHAPATSNIIFTKSATESINLVAQSLQDQLNTTHSICVTAMEHHANLLPWQRLCQRTGARLNVLPVNDDGTINTSQLEHFVNDNCALLAISHVSNVTGIQNDVQWYCQTARQHNVPVLIDGAQAVGHLPVDVSKIDCDYYVFSGHKMYATTGIGVLYTKLPAEQRLTPLLLGGGIVNKVSPQHYQLKPGVEQFEAGSANMVGIVGLLAAIEFIDSIGWSALSDHQQMLGDYLLLSLASVAGIEIIANGHKADNGTAVYSFIHKQVHSHDVASILALDNVAVRAGHHCAQPYLKALGYKHSVRVSLGCYNDKEDIDRLVCALAKVNQTFG